MAKQIKKVGNVLILTARLYCEIAVSASALIRRPSH